MYAARAKSLRRQAQRRQNQHEEKVALERKLALISPVKLRKYATTLQSSAVRGKGLESDDFDRADEEMARQIQSKIPVRMVGRIRIPHGVDLSHSSGQALGKNITGVVEHSSSDQ